ncbi:LuxR family transcriptional regulator [Pseudomonas cichorii]|uniref:LuxR family transcriptional regulator n=1 Tax=Pseudomonas lijiangensis TaxID=2995658 RepID=A0ABX8HY04_9PSED|nr:MULTISPECIES: LuxR family transcriptional regulator [Pseudomonas syringae group]MBX8488717.1 LuxR family transcriptional regulator [Pseudomonas cichorii]MBX8498663.1 LuxR family transcriptional regulator [Pseudomonas lijiangensis]MBX8503569.1 LuxR family transcriptional regulator [Pseudomonas lijiangensis]MBX8510485.1 LuxR family transcriptional regulator [Pseudomonas cichorii]MBX8522736.1 LuxR family transcriptional regulator [Pseudomonas cichorii]
MPIKLPGSQVFDLLIEAERNFPAASETEYISSLASLFGKLSVDYFAYLHMDLTPLGISRVSIFSNYPAEWIETYRKKSLYKKDPIIIHSANTSSPFFWSEVLRPKHVNLEVVEQSAHYGIEQGFTVPMHEPGRTFGSMHLAASLANKAFVPSVKAHQLAIKAISDLAHHNRPQPSSTSDSLRLTPRENEFLRWLSMGKTYREIGLIMNISERTVKFYAHQMTEKLECVNVKQAMMKAMYLNLV